MPRPKASELNPRAAARVRDNIEVAKIVRRLQMHLMGEIDPITDEPFDLTPSQMKAAEILLRKALPDLSAIEQTNLNPEKTYLVQVPSPIEDGKAWEKQAKEVTEKMRLAKETKH
jgi:hypothetical protein